MRLAVFACACMQEMAEGSAFLRRWLQGRRCFIVETDSCDVGADAALQLSHLAQVCSSLLLDITMVEHVERENGNCFGARCRRCHQVINIPTVCQSSVNEAFRIHASVCGRASDTGKTSFANEFLEKVGSQFEESFKWAHAARDPSRVVVKCIGGCVNTSFSSASPNLLDKLRRHIRKRHIVRV